MGERTEDERWFRGALSSHRRSERRLQKGDGRYYRC